MDAADQDIKRQYDLLYANASKKLEQQIQSLGAIDTKAGILLAAIGVIFAGYLQLLTSGPLGLGEKPALVAVEIALFVLAGFFVFKAFVLDRNEGWWDDPRPKKLVDYFARNHDLGEYNLKDQVIKSISASYEHNDAKMVEKYRHLHVARLFLYAGVVILAIHLLAEAVRN